MFQFDLKISTKDFEFNTLNFVLLHFSVTPCTKIYVNLFSIIRLFLANLKLNIFNIVLAT